MTAAMWHYLCYDKVTLHAIAKYAFVAMAEILSLNNNASAKLGTVTPH